MPFLIASSSPAQYGSSSVYWITPQGMDLANSFLQFGEFMFCVIVGLITIKIIVGFFD